ncbi:MAG: c-type cytochrome [Caulobacteraceae bacterium]
MSVVTGRAPDPPPRERRTHWRRLAETWLLAWIAAGVMATAAAMAVIWGGLFNATASTPHYPPIGWAAHAAFVSSVKARAGAAHPPPRFTAAQTLAGFREYRGDCELCHGGPGVARAPWTDGMIPTPPFLIDSARRWSPAQLDWIVGQGIKMTAMPAWRATHTPAEIWNLVAFLEALPYLSARDYARMAAADGPRDAASPATLSAAGRGRR